METNQYRRNDYQTDIVIPVWNQADLAYRCIDSIQNNTPPEQYHITVIDNGSDYQPFYYWVEQRFENINVFHLPFNHGFCRAANLGIAASLLTNSEHVLLLNSDTQIPAGDKTWLERLTEPMRANVTCGAVGAVSNNVAGYQQRLKPDPDATFHYAPMLIGFCLLLRKSAVESVGMLDERFEPGNFDDFDYSLRLQQAGYKLAVAESVFIHHAMHASFKELDKTESFNGLLIQNAQKLKDKWGAEALRGVGL